MVVAVAAVDGWLALLGMFLLTTAFYALTAHVAARYVLGDVPITSALLVGPVPAIVLLALLEFQPLLAVVLAFVADFVAIKLVYDIPPLRAGLVTVVHYAVSALTVVLVASLAGVI